jgi:hypothetical protein
LVGAIQGDSSELGAVQTTTGRIGIDAENLASPRLLFDHRRGE